MHTAYVSSCTKLVTITPSRMLLIYPRNRQSPWAYPRQAISHVTVHAVKLTNNFLYALFNLCLGTIKHT